MSAFKVCFQKISIPTPHVILNWREVLKVKLLKEIYQEPELEFLEGWRGLAKKNLFDEGGGGGGVLLQIFSGVKQSDSLTTNMKHQTLSECWSRCPDQY